MADLVLVGVCALVALIASHLVLSWAEARGWVYYRRSPKHGGSAYHLMQMSAIFDPKFQQVIETMVEDEREEEESGDPKPGDGATDGRQPNREP